MTDVSNLALFFIGVAVTIPAAGGIGGLMLAAIADGRENDRIQAEIAKTDGPPSSHEGRSPSDAPVAERRSDPM